MGGVGSCVRQTARGDDPDPCASTGATRSVAARRRRAGAIARGERRDDRSNAQRREGCGGRRPSSAGRFYSAIRREVPIRTLNGWKKPAPGFCEIDVVAGGTPVAGSFIQTLTLVDVATGSTDCLRWSIATAALSSRRSRTPRACSLGCWRYQLRQRQCVHERGRHSLVSRTEARGDAITSLQGALTRPWSSKRTARSSDD